MWLPTEFFRRSSFVKRYQQGDPSFLETGKSPTVPCPDCTENARRCPNGIAHATRLVSAGQYADVHCRVEIQPYKLTARCVDGRGLVTFKDSWQVGRRVGMVNPLEMMNTVVWGGEESVRLGSRNLTEVCVWTIMGFCAEVNLYGSIYNRSIPREGLPLREDNLRSHQTTGNE